MRAPRLFWMIAVTGCLLRILCVLSTPYDDYAYDAREHLDYIEYVATHHAIPPGSAGWEYHQSPLYYAIAGTWWNRGAALGMSERGRILVLQSGSLLLSLTAFLLSLRLTILLFGKKKKSDALLFCASLLAVVPGFVLFSHRISNDVPFLTLSFLFLLQLQHWWQSPTQKRWLLLWVIVALTILVRVTALAYVPITLLCLVASKIPAGRKRVWLIQGMSILVALTGWLFLWRALEPSSVRLLSFGNAFMNPALGVGEDWRSFVLFRPSAFLFFPFNHPFLDIAGRQYFWEFFFRSIFFGEFRFFPLATLSSFILMLASLLVPCTLFGLAKGIEQKLRPFFPIIVSFFVLLSTLVCYRFLFPFSSNQDIRLMPLLYFPLSFFLALGLEYAPALLRPTLRMCAFLLCIFCGVFLVMLGFIE